MKGLHRRSSKPSVASVLNDEQPSSSTCTEALAQTSCLTGCTAPDGLCLRRLSSSTAAELVEVVEVIDEILNWVRDLPSSRETALASTKLEEAALWLMKASSE